MFRILRVVAPDDRRTTASRRPLRSVPGSRRRRAGNPIVPWRRPEVNGETWAPARFVGSTDAPERCSRGLIPFCTLDALDLCTVATAERERASDGSTRCTNERERAGVARPTGSRFFRETPCERGIPGHPGGAAVP